MSESLTSVSRLRPLLSVVVSEVEISESFLFRSLNETVFFLPRRLCHVKKTFQVNLSSVSFGHEEKNLKWGKMSQDIFLRDSGAFDLTCFESKG